MEQEDQQERLEGWCDQARLTGMRRQVALARWVHSTPYADLARETGRSEGALKMLVVRAKQAILIMLKPAQDEPLDLREEAEVMFDMYAGPHPYHRPSAARARQTEQQARRSAREQDAQECERDQELRDIVGGRLRHRTARDRPSRTRIDSVDAFWRRLKARSRVEPEPEPDSGDASPLESVGGVAGRE